MDYYKQAAMAQKVATDQVGGGIGLSGSILGGSASAPASSMDQIEASLVQSLDGVREAITRVVRIAEAVYGPRNEAQSGQADLSDVKPASGRMHSITTTQEKLNSKIGDLHAAISRIEGLA